MSSFVDPIQTQQFIFDDTNIHKCVGAYIVGTLRRANQTVGYIKNLGQGYTHSERNLKKRIDLCKILGIPTIPEELMRDGAISNWNVSGVTNMRKLFYYEHYSRFLFVSILSTWKLNKIYDKFSTFDLPLNNWGPHLSNVTDMSDMFRSARSFNQRLDSWGPYLSNVTNMSGMFWSADIFNQRLDSWNVSNVTNMSDMFHNAHHFDNPLNSWNVSKVTDMSGMFRYAENFDQPLNSWGPHLSNVTNMSFMFSGAKIFNQRLDSWNVSNVTNMSSMFSFAGDFDQPLNSWNVSNVTNMSFMFSGAKSFNQPLDSWNVSKVTDMAGMFLAAHLFNQPLNSWGQHLYNVTNMSDMFRAARSFNQPLNSWGQYLYNIRYMSDIFYQATNFNQNLSEWPRRLYGVVPNLDENCKPRGSFNHECRHGPRLPSGPPQQNIEFIFNPRDSMTHHQLLINIYEKWYNHNLTGEQGFFNPKSEIYKKYEKKFDDLKRNGNSDEITKIIFAEILGMIMPNSDKDIKLGIMESPPENSFTKFILQKSNYSVLDETQKTQINGLITKYASAIEIELSPYEGGRKRRYNYQTKKGSHSLLRKYNKTKKAVIRTKSQTRKERKN